VVVQLGPSRNLSTTNHVLRFQCASSVWYDDWLSSLDKFLKRHGVQSQVSLYISKIAQKADIKGASRIKLVGTATWWGLAFVMKCCRVQKYSWDISCIATSLRSGKNRSSFGVDILPYTRVEQLGEFKERYGQWWLALSQAVLNIELIIGVDETARVC